MDNGLFEREASVMIVCEEGRTRTEFCFLQLPFANAAKSRVSYASACHAFFNRSFFSRRILTYLIPLRMLRGHLPSSELLGRFPGLERLYSPFVAAVRKGDIRAFDTALDRAERKLLELNVLLALEKSRELCLRGVFRRA